ncbi:MULTISPECIES: DUF4365 domain-containing protein [Acinetobacter calcoaceticus/baumannii complex]|uniref:DUF4365 domain-containing protein n=1 Tax=Acinetobacter calcoaceticus/baumannii complex TaxID=909768 RepID=UPI0019517EEA|nr:DUF4365 domain-containing protein [Acinetobacter pittii]QRQ12341.1 DUF4365 domain-containing protein [Acinetobacter pittii]HAV5769559.1 DUF4365 domain-containing protein [Acinetobacter baumannii]
MSDNLPTEGLGQEIGRNAKDIFAIKRPRSWILKELDGDTDFGIDYIVQVHNPQKQVEFSFYLQLKGTQSPKYSSDNLHIKHQFKTKTLNYYLRQDSIVMVVIVDLKDEDEDEPGKVPVFYQWLDEAWFRKQSVDLDQQDHFTVSVPTENKVVRNLEIYDFLKDRYHEKIAAENLKFTIKDLNKPVVENLELISEKIKTKPIYLESMATDNLEPWINDPEGAVASQLKICARYFDNNKIKEAKDLLIKLEPKSIEFSTHELAEFHLQLGNLAIFEDKYEEALEQFEKADSFKINNRYLYTYLLNKIRYLDLSNEQLEEILSLPLNDNHNAHLIRAIAMTLMGKKQEALSYFKEKQPEKVMRQLLICMNGELYDEADQIIATYVQTDLDSDEDKFLYQSLAAQRYFHRATGKESIYNTPFPLEGFPDFDIGLMTSAFNAIEKAWEINKNLNYKFDIEPILSLSPFIYGYFNKSNHLFSYLEPLLHTRPTKSVLRQASRIQYDYHNFSEALVLIEQLKELDAEEKAMLIICLFKESRHQEALDFLARHEQEIISTCGNSAIQLFIMASGIASELLNTNLAEKYQKIVEEMPDAEAALALQKFIRSSHLNQNYSNEALKELYQTYLALHKPKILAEQLIIFIQPESQETALEYIDVAEKILESQELSNQKYLGLCQALFIVKNWPRTIQIAEKNIKKGLSIGKWSLIKIGAQFNLGLIGLASNQIHQMLNNQNLDDEDKKFYIELCLRMGLGQKIIKQMVGLLPNIKSKFEKVKLLFQIINIYKSNSKYAIELQNAIFSLGTYVDQNDYYQEGNYLAVFMTCIMLRGSHKPAHEIYINDFIERQHKYFKQFPESTIFRSAIFPKNATGEELIAFLNKLTGRDQAHFDQINEIIKKIRNGEYHFPFAFRQKILQNTANIFQAWHNACDKSEKHLDYKIIHNPVNTNEKEIKAFIENSSGYIVLDETNLLLLNQLDLLDIFLKELPRFTLLRSVFNRIKSIAHDKMQLFSEQADKIWISIQSNIDKLTLIEEDEFLEYVESLKDVPSFIFTEDKILYILLKEKIKDLNSGNIFNIISYLYENNAITKSIFVEKISEFFILDFKGVTFSAKDVHRYMAYVLEDRTLLNEYRSSPLSKLIDYYLSSEDEQAIKLRNSLVFLRYLNLYELDTDVLSNITNHILEQIYNFDSYYIISTYLLTSGLRLELRLHPTTQLSLAHKNLWKKYKALMELNSETTFTDDFLISTFLSVLLRLKSNTNDREIILISENNIKQAYSNLLHSFSLNTAEHTKIESFKAILGY